MTNNPDAPTTPEPTMQEMIDELLKILLDIASGFVDVSATEFQDPEDSLHRTFIHHEQAESLCCGIFCDNKQPAGVNWAAVIVFQKAGFPVVALERDDSGWMIGGVYIKRNLHQPRQVCLSFG